MPDHAGAEPTADEGPWTWDWFDASPRGETYGVRRGDEVLCYTNRFRRGYEDARRIADALNSSGVVPSDPPTVESAGIGPETSLDEAVTPSS